jgi:hypothetical protein
MSLIYQTLVINCNSRNRLEKHNTTVNLVIEFSLKRVDQLRSMLLVNLDWDLEDVSGWDPGLLHWT